MERLELSSATVLRLAPRIVFRFDDTRQRWIMLAPERLMLPDEQAVGGDVTAMLQELADKGCLTNDRMD
jgi:hypothetical protein